MNERKVFKELDGKDLINIGVFTAIYFVVVFAVAMLGMIAPSTEMISDFTMPESVT